MHKAAGDLAANMIPNGHLESKVKAGEHLEKSHETIDLRTSQALADFNDINQEVGDPLQGSLSTTASVASLFRESVLKFVSSLKCQIHVPLFLVITLAVILLLMQVHSFFNLACVISYSESCMTVQIFFP